MQTPRSVHDAALSYRTRRPSLGTCDSGKLGAALVLLCEPSGLTGGSRREFGTSAERPSAASGLRVLTQSLTMVRKLRNLVAE